MDKRLIKKDKLSRFKFNHKEKKLYLLKFLGTNKSKNFNNFLQKNNYKKKVFYKIFQLQKFTITKIRNRCLLTNSSRAVSTKYKLARRALKSLFQEIKCPTNSKK